MQLTGSARHGSCFPQTRHGSYRAALRLSLILFSLGVARVTRNNHHTPHP